MAIFGGVVGGATSGIGQALGALAMGGRAEQQGYDGEMLNQSKIAQALAQMQQAQAQMRLQDAQAAEKAAETARAAARPGMVDMALAASAGVDIPTLGAFRQKMTTGQAPQVPMGPPAEDGGMGVGSAQFGEQTTSRLGQALQRYLPASMAEKDINPEQWAKAQGVYRGMDLGDDVLGGRRTAAQVGRAQAAVEAKPLYNSDASGGVLDVFGGGYDTSNPMAQETIKLKGAQAGEASAGGRAKDAQAGLYRAQRDEVVTGNGKSGGKAPAGYRWTADGRALETIPGGPADKTHGASEGERKAGTLLLRLRGSQQQMLNAIGETASADKPVAVAEFVRKIPIVGDVAANGLTPENRQRVEAAQLDMLDAALTLGTGAAYTREQLEGYRRSYFPVLNDDQKTREDKRVRLANILRAAEIAAGRSAEGAVPVVPGPGGPQTGGASGGWGDAPAAPNGQRVVRVPY